MELHKCKSVAPQYIAMKKSIMRREAFHKSHPREAAYAETWDRIISGIKRDYSPIYEPFNEDVLNAAD